MRQKAGLHGLQTSAADFRTQRLDHELWNPPNDLWFASIATFTQTFIILWFASGEVQQHSFRVSGKRTNRNVCMICMTQNNIRPSMFRLI
jgi:hypothetical protein